MSRAAKTDFAFDPTMPGAWHHYPVDSLEFRRMVRRFGWPVRHGPAPSVLYSGDVVPIVGDGSALYAVGRTWPTHLQPIADRTI
jgi:hypothetical protein